MRRLDFKQFILGIIILLGLVVVYQEFFSAGGSEPLDFGPRVEGPLIISSQDQNGNKVPDALDLVNGARREVKLGTQYDATYYEGGYPPEGRGACTDVIWRAFKEAGYDLKSMLDEDIKLHPEAYGNTGKNPDPNIDFRRVKNLQIFFDRYAKELTAEVIQRDIENLKQWQPGDIVIFSSPYEPIGIISDQRLNSGVPLVIHNGGPQASENNALQHWPSPIIKHYRFFV